MPVAAPVTPPVRAPVAAPVAHTPVSAPVRAPVQAPVAAPVHSPATHTPTSAPSTPRPGQVLRGPFPAIVPQSGSNVFWTTRGFSNSVWCRINDQQPYNGNLISSHWSQTAVCETPQFNSTTSFNISVSSDGQTFFGPSTIRVYCK